MTSRASCALTFCLAVTASNASASPPPESPVVERALSRMSLADQAGQVLMITTGGGRRFARASARLLREIQPGGVTLFRYHVRGQRAAAVRAYTAAIEQNVSAVRPLLAIDQEGGPVARLAGILPALPSSRELGRSGREDLAESAGRIVGAALRDLGFNVNLAPVLDVPRARGGRYLARRVFGADAGRVARLGAAYVRGLHDGGVAAAAKHFPGEGTSRGDPHRGFPTARAARPELVRIDLAPFREARPDLVMMGHVRFPALGPHPASLEPAAYALLRNEARFDGVAMTDGLEMRSIRARYGLARAVVMALRAGADLVSVFWSPARVREAKAAIVRAVRSGELPGTRLAEAVRRVLRLKAARGLLGPAPAPARDVSANLRALRSQVALLWRALRADRNR